MRPSILWVCRGFDLAADPTPGEIPRPRDGGEEQAGLSTRPSLGCDVVSGEAEGEEGNDAPDPFRNLVNAFGHGEEVVSTRKVPVGFKMV